MYEGVFTAMVTPFDDNGGIDEKTLRNLVDQQAEAGVQGLVPVGTTGESPTLDHDENIEVIRIVADQASGRLPVIGGTGSNSTREAVDLTLRAKDAGADASLQVSPYYNKPTQEGLYQHYKSIADDGGLPVIIYNIPGRTSINIENETLLRLSEIDAIVGVKEATGNLAQAMDFMARKPPDFTVLSGDDNMTLPLMILGGNGVVSVASNLVPAELVRFVESALGNDWERARKEHFRLLPLFKSLFIETNPIPVKSAMAMKGLLKEVYRLPMCRIADKNRETLERVIRELGIVN